jgi:hypothetical protein
MKIREFVHGPFPFVEAGILCGFSNRVGPVYDTPPTKLRWDEGRANRARSSDFNLNLCIGSYAKETRTTYCSGGRFISGCGMPSHLDRPMRRERRKHFRLGWHLPATIYDAGRHLERPCTLIDLSNGGAKLAGVRAYTIPDEFRLRTPLGDRRSCRVIWRTEDTLGVEFTDHVDGDDDSGHRPAAREPTDA